MPSSSSSKLHAPKMGDLSHNFSTHLNKSATTLDKNPKWQANKLSYSRKTGEVACYNGSNKTKEIWRYKVSSCELLDEDEAMGIITASSQPQSNRKYQRQKTKRIAFKANSKDASSNDDVIVQWVLGLGNHSNYTKMVTTYAMKYMKSKYFLKLKLSDLQEILKSNKIEGDEVFVFRAVAKWCSNHVINVSHKYSDETTKSKDYTLFQAIKWHLEDDGDDESVPDWPKAISKLSCFPAIQKFFNTELSRFVRYPLMSTVELTGEVEPSKLVQRHYLIETYRYQTYQNCHLTTKSIKDSDKKRAGLVEIPDSLKSHIYGANDDKYTQSVLATIPMRMVVRSDTGRFKGTTILSRKQQAILFKFTKKGIKQKWVLLYKATIHGFKGSVFHSNCNGKKNTMSIVKSKQGMIFGGFTPLPWDSSGSYKSDTASWLYTMVNNEALPPSRMNKKNNNANYSICNGSSYGPTFGGGHDFMVCDNSNTVNSSYSNADYTYAIPKGVKVKNNFLAGSYNFMTIDVEVFQNVKA